MRSTAYVIGPFGSGAHERATLPYGAQHLSACGYEVTYADPERSRIYSSPLARRGVRGAQRLIGTPLFEPVLEPLRLRRAGVVVCFLEDNLTLLAPAVRLLRRGPARPSVVVVVWLTARVSGMRPRTRRRWRRRLLAFDRVVVLSRNQVELLQDALGLPDGLVQAVTFGVDPLPERPAPSGSATVLTCGGDRARDYATFAKAMAGDTDTVLITTSERRAELPDLAPIVVVGPVARSEYLERLRDAAVVVSPTRAVEYPSGQTALIEAMQTGRACVVTRSPALEEYLSDGVDGLTVAPGDPVALRAAVDRLRDDAELRTRLGNAAAVSAARFTESAMWARIVDGLVR